MVSHKLIQGSSFSDARGTLNFFNSFNMEEVARFYEISPSSTEIIRAWQGHKQEKKWFYCNSGAFIINLIKVDNFDAPSHHLIPERYQISAGNRTILEISGGYANGFKATKPDSKLLVFSSFSLTESKKDDFRYPADLWPANW